MIVHLVLAKIQQWSKEVKVESRWSPQMYHRLATVDLLIALESAVLKRGHLAIVKTFLDNGPDKNQAAIAP
jgi:hypothetical protein